MKCYTNKLTDLVLATTAIIRGVWSRGESGAAATGPSSLGGAEGANGMKKKIFFIFFCETRAVFAMCIITDCHLVV